jgi:hypothetical protein
MRLLDHICGGGADQLGAYIASSLEIFDLYADLYVRHEQTSQGMASGSLMAEAAANAKKQMSTACYDLNSFCRRLEEVHGPDVDSH